MSRHPFEDTPQYEQIYGNSFGPPIGRPGNGLGDVWGGSGDPEDDARRRPRLNDSSQVDLYAVHSDDHFEEVEEPEDMTAELVLAIECLTPKQRFVIELRYGLRDGTAYTQQEVAELMGVQRPQVSRLESRAIERMREWNESW